MSIKKPSAVESPYVTIDTTPTRLASGPVAGGGVNTVAATATPTVSANARDVNTNASSTGSNVSYYTSGIEGIAGLASYGRVFDGANVYVTLEQPQYITYNQNYTGSGTVGGANGQVQFNNSGNFGGSANLTFDGANLVVGSKVTAGQVSAVGNVAGNYFIGNGSQLTGLPATYGNANVVANLAALGSNPVSTTGNITSGNLLTSGVVSAAGNVRGGNINTVGGVFSNSITLKNTDDFAQIVFSSDGGATNNGQIKVDGGTNMVVSAASNYYVKQAGSDRLAITNTDTNLMASTNVVIQSNKSGTANTWTFGNNGNLTFPENSGDNWPINQQRFGMGNIGAWLDGQWTIGEFSGNSVSGEFGIRIDPSIEGPVGMTFPSSATSNTQPVQIYSTNGGGIELYTGGNNWAFNADGNLVLPNGAVIKDTPGDSVAFGQNAGDSGQSQHAVAIGPNAGQNNQGEDSVAIGYNTAQTDQGQRAIAIGWGAGATSQQIWGQAYGQDAGGYHQTSGAIAMGLSAGLNLQSQEAIAIGTNAGYGGGEGKTVYSTQNANTIRLYTSNNNLYPGMKVVGGSIGATSGIVITSIIGGEDVSLSSDVSLNNGDNLIFYNQQGTQAIAIGSSAGENLQGYHAVAVGYQAGQTRQGADAVAIGEDAGNYAQGTNSIAIGRTAGTNLQGNSAIAMGWNAGQDAQRQQAIAIGEDAGSSSQGAYSIAVGFKAGFYSQGNNSIILNATGTALNMTTANSFTVAPVRASTLNNYSQDTGNVLYYNTSTNEVTTAPLNNITGDPFAANIYDSTSNVTVWTASSDEVVGAKLTVRVVYFAGGWANTEMLDIMIAKNYPNGTPAFTVSNRVKTNPAYSDTLIDVTLATGNVLQVISSAPSGAGNNVYWTCSATSFNQTLD